ncbi:MAG TPA: hypothetical protein VL172_09720 [Kofleriaceae bacterium]|nr:hypothetical protein [Kofleriaceae bacterium]
MRPRLVLLLAALLGAWSAPARADEPVTLPWQYGITFAGGAMQIGGLGFTELGLQLRVGRALTPTTRLVATGDMLSSYRGDPDDLLMGETLRGTLGVDWDAGWFGDRGSIAGVITVNAGAGTELITWERGLVSRPIAYLGAQLGVGFLFPRGNPVVRGPRGLGMSFGVRGLVAPGIGRDKLPRAASSPPPAPGGPPVELGILAYMGLDFGR